MAELRKLEYSYSKDYRIAFEDMSALIFCTYLGLQSGVNRRINQRGIEADPVFINNKYYSFQAKYFDAATRLRDKKNELIQSIEDARMKGVTNLLLFINKDLPDQIAHIDNEKTDYHEPNYIIEIKKAADGSNGEPKVELDWWTLSRIESTLDMPRYRYIQGIYLNDKALVYNEDDDIKTCFSFDYKSDFYDMALIGRAQELKEIQSHLERRKVLFIYGIEGIGKTSLVKQYAYEYRDKYSAIFYFSCIKPIESIVSDDMLFPSMGLSRKITKEGMIETDFEYYCRKLSKIRDNISEDILFILDDYNTNHENIDYLLSLNAKFIIITHRNLQPLDNLMHIEPLKTNDLLCSLFLRCYRRNDIACSDIYLLQLFNLVDGHTLSIILMAKQMMVNRMFPEEFYERIDHEGLRNALSEEISMSNMGPSKKAFSFISELFKVSELSSDEFNVLKLLSAISPARVKCRDFALWCEYENVYSILERLHLSGWIEKDDANDTVSVLTIIKEVIIEHEKITFTGGERIIQSFLLGISDFEIYALPLADKYYYVEIVKELIKWSIPVNKFTIRFYIKSSKVMSLFFPEEASSMLQSLLSTIPKAEEYYYDIGYLHYCNGWTQISKMNRTEAGIIEYEIAESFFDKAKVNANLNTDVLNFYADFGISLCRAGKGAKAIVYLQKVIELMDTMVPRSEYIRKICWYKAFLVECYLQINDINTAKMVLEEAYKLQKQFSGIEDAHLSNLLYRDSLVSFAIGDYKKALNTVLKGYSIYERYYPEKSVRNVKHLCFIGCIFAKNNDAIRAQVYFDKAKHIAEQFYDDVDEVISNIKQEYGLE